MKNKIMQMMRVGTRKTALTGVDRTGDIFKKKNIMRLPLK